jgi:hypothetical protein
VSRPGGRDFGDRNLAIDSTISSLGKSAFYGATLPLTPRTPPPSDIKHLLLVFSHSSRPSATPTTDDEESPDVDGSSMQTRCFLQQILTARTIGDRFGDKLYSIFIIVFFCFHAGFAGLWAGTKLSGVHRRACDSRIGRGRYCPRSLAAACGCVT